MKLDDMRATRQLIDKIIKLGSRPIKLNPNQPIINATSPATLHSLTNATLRDRFPLVFISGQHSIIFPQYFEDHHLKNINATVNDWIKKYYDHERFTSCIRLQINLQTVTQILNRIDYYKFNPLFGTGLNAEDQTEHFFAQGVMQIVTSMFGNEVAKAVLNPTPKSGSGAMVVSVLFMKPSYTLGKPDEDNDWDLDLDLD